MQVDQLKIELKTWEHQFIAQNGRGPTKEDIKKLPEVKYMYRQYSSLKKHKNPITTTTTPSKVHAFFPSKSVFNASDSNALEFGPTPQIYGKTISIFEMKLSPIKPPPVSDTHNETQIQPSPSSTISQDDAYTTDDERTLDVKRQLKFCVATPNSSPFKSHKSSNSNYYGPNSPLKLEEENINISIVHKSPSKRTPVKNLLCPSSTVSFSPSPLVKMPSTRSLLELMKEHEAIVEEFKQMEEGSDTAHFQKSENIFTEEQQETIPGNSIVKTRARKILRRLAPNEENKEVKRNISRELLKLKKQRVKEFLGNEIITEEGHEGPESESEKEEEQKEEVKKVPKKRNKKYNLVSNNFRRLRLPRKHSSNRRWPGKRR